MPRSKRSIEERRQRSRQYYADHREERKASIRKSQRGTPEHETPKEREARYQRHSEFMKEWHRKRKEEQQWA